MVRNGTILNTDSGRNVQIDSLLKAGGQGLIYKAHDSVTGQECVVKVFNGKFDKVSTTERIRFLIDQKLEMLCSALMPPADLITKGKMVGHCTPFVPGESLKELLISPNCTFLDILCIAGSIVQVIAVLHKHEIAYGDIHANNFIIMQAGGVFRVNAIDFDNFNAAGVPPPPMIGHNLYIPPEIRSALAQGKPAVPTIQSDLYELGVLLHEVILLSHPATGSDGVKRSSTER
jgi:serine/threonine protein kinase